MASSDKYKKYAKELSDKKLARNLALSDIQTRYPQINRDDISRAGYFRVRTDPSLISQDEEYSKRVGKDKQHPLRESYFTELDKAFKKIKSTRPETKNAPFALYHPDIEKMIEKKLKETRKNQIKNKRGGGVIGRNKIIKGYKKGGQV
tara:strand:+ start:30 stop:473 length:444 start_codon:yes stop_codon:yes gene_type:complete